MKKVLLSLFVSLILASPAVAGQISANLSITAEVTPECSLSTSPLSFAGYTGVAQVSGSGEVSVQCSNGTTYKVGLDAGQNLGLGSDPTYRALSDGNGHYLSYVLYSSIFPTAEWGDSGITGGSSYQKSVLAVNSDGSLKNIGVLGDLSADASAVPGSYSDTVTVVVEF